MNPSIPGDLLRSPGQPYSPPELEELVKFMQKSDNKQPIPTTKHQQTIVPDPPLTIKRVYAKQHKAIGLDAPYEGPFPVVSRPTRSSVKIKVGLTARGEPRYEVRSWRDLKVAPDEDAPDAEKPRKGRRPKESTSQSEPATTTEPRSEVNKTQAEIPVLVTPNQPVEPADQIPPPNSNERGKRSTRNPRPIYVDSMECSGPPPFRGFPVNRTWSASEAELAAINQSIRGI